MLVVGIIILVAFYIIMGIAVPTFTFNKYGSTSNPDLDGTFCVAAFIAWPIVIMVILGYELGVWLSKGKNDK